VAKNVRNGIEFTATGTVPDLHRIPYTKITAANVLQNFQ